MSNYRFASQTEVSVAKSREQIERYLQRYGAKTFVYGWQEGTDDTAHVAVKFESRLLRFKVPNPDPASEDFAFTRRGKLRTKIGRNRAYAQSVRQRWRAFALSVISKLEMVESGIEIFDEAFATNIVLPNGETVGDVITPQISRALQYGDQLPEDMIPALPHFKVERASELASAGQLELPEPEPDVVEGVATEIDPVAANVLAEVVVEAVETLVMGTPKRRTHAQKSRR